MNRLVWVDCEMTGLDIERDALIEVAVIVTDSELNALDEGLNIVIRPPAEALTAMGDVVRRMHTESGLLERLDGGVSLAEAQEQVIAHVRRHLPESPRPPLAGNSVATDRMFLDRDLPDFAALLHYRIVDVSSIKELARRWFPKAYYASPEKHGGHRALGDIEDSIDELRYYRATVFTPAPGPDTTTCRAAAARIVAAHDDGPTGAGVEAAPDGAAGAAGAEQQTAAGTQAAGAPVDADARSGDPAR